ncbi:ABC-type metal ion transport system, ATpase component [Clostridium aceticum]|uniref:ABC-type metal ion transport system, ATpase component n=1 Tax=Clostridium aceticum TaxID=84022 RepID=A0A0D8IEE6_9CLOT|nr:ATP-binding cassette domain-containing protein [Clostridium aceticum]AKL93898.1 ABC-type metal ion transport system, ATpase component [Clostridium aceticum]KJF28710.1 ABC transporter [Clostridium aceticum]
MIQLKNVSKLYESKEGNVLALKNINLTINKGDIYGIMGLSGAGKSTLIRCINLLESPTNGEVWVDGVDLTKLSHNLLRQSRRNMGMIFQNYHLLTSRNVEKNVAYPLELNNVKKHEINERVEQLLQLVGLWEKRKHYPSQLSGGQRQRVAIARALATNPQVLLSDEATSALDPITSRSILNLLQEINEKLNITVVLITHQMEVIEQICKKVAVLKDGEVVEEGSVHQVFKTPQHPYTKLLLGNKGLEKHQPIPLDLFRNVKAGGL